MMAPMGDVTLAQGPALAPVHRRMRPLVWADAEVTVGDAARKLSGTDHSCLLVRLPSGPAIATDHDFRTWLAEPHGSREAPVTRIVSTPVVTVPAAADASTALLLMVETGVHHLVATGDAGEPVGVVRAVDLASAEVRDPLLVRRMIRDAHTPDDLAKAATRLRASAVELAELGTPALQVTALVSALRDLVVQRAVELAPADAGFAVRGEHVSWLVLGSSARREALPGSDVDTALAWSAELDIDAERLRSEADVVLRLLEACGLPRCPDGANATEALFSRSVPDWLAATRRWTSQPESEGALLLSSIVADHRAVTNVEVGRELTRSMLASARGREFLDGLLTFTLACRPARGTLRPFVLEHSGSHQGLLDLKRGGLWPVVLLGRWLGLVAGDPSGSTVDRVRRGRDTGLLTTGEAEDLVAAYELMFQLRFDQGLSTRAAGPADDGHLAPESLDPLRRRYQVESLRAVAKVQDGVRKTWSRRSKGPGPR